MSVALTTSRSLEYFSEKELSMQAGAGPDEWGLLLLKELIDNALDACEAADVAPDIRVEISPQDFIVTDNGPGIPPDVVARSLDYSVRVSDKALRVTPTRGQLGNALKLCYAAPYALGDEAHIEITARGTRHDIRVSVDEIRQQPVIHHQQGDAEGAGTSVRIHSGQLAGQLLAEDGFSRIGPWDLVDRVALFNPHAAICVVKPDGERAASATAGRFTKWHIGRPAAAHWHSERTFRDLVAGFIPNGHGQMPLRDFLAEFHGLRGTKVRQEVLEAADLLRVRLDDLRLGSGLNDIAIYQLLHAMQARSRPVKAQALGVLGREHFEAAMAQGYDATLLGYQKLADDEGPFVLEVAIGAMGEDRSRLPIVGLNNAVPLKEPIQALSRSLSECRIDAYDPVLVVVHIAAPRFTFSEHGKGNVVLTEAMKAALAEAVKKAAKDWTKAKKQSDREGRIRRAHLERFRKATKPPSMKASCYKHMQAAYVKASADSTLPANARQIMYAIRPHVISDCGAFYAQDATFTQTILPDFIAEHPALTKDWDVIYDERGHFVEPHTDTKLGVGTLAVRDYIQAWSEPALKASAEIEMRVRTAGPQCRYGAVLFVEKEGFNPLIAAGRIAERYDVAILSTKGMSVTAARQLVTKLNEEGVPVLVARDLDKPGFSIVETLRSDTRRYQFDAKPNVIDLGLRLEDAERMGLQREAVTYNSDVTPAERLRACGATEAEIAMLVSGGASGRWAGERIELNAMTSRQFLDWLEDKLQAAGVRKVAPNDDILTAAYHRAVKLKQMKAACDRIAASEDLDDVSADLAERVRAGLVAEPEKAWDDVVAKLVAEDGKK